MNPEALPGTSPRCVRRYQPRRSNAARTTSTLLRAEKTCRPTSIKLRLAGVGDKNLTGASKNEIAYGLCSVEIRGVLVCGNAHITNVESSRVEGKSG